MKKRKKSTRRKTARRGRNIVKFAASFRHYRTGVVYFAKDYGHCAWPIRRRAAA